MKKSINILTICIIFAIAGCSNSSTTNNGTTEKDSESKSALQSSSSAEKSPKNEPSLQSGSSAEKSPENEPSLQSNRSEEKAHESTPAKQSSKQEYFIKTVGNRPYAAAFHKGIMYMVTAPASGNGMLWKVTPDGEKHEFAKLEGDFAGNYLTDKSFISSGIDFDEDSNVYITLGDRLVKISPDGEVSTIAEGFSRCFDVKLDPDGNMYVADDKEDTIYSFTPSMEKSIFYKGSEKGDFLLTSLAFDKNYDNLYVREGKKILKFNLSPDMGSEIPEIVAEDIDIFDICIDGNNNIYASTSSNKIIKVDANGQVAVLAKNGLIHSSIGLSIGCAEFDANSLYVADTYGIVKVPLEN